MLRLLCPAQAADPVRICRGSLQEKNMRLRVADTMENASSRIAVIGGGASGCMAAIAAAQAGSRVTIFEKNEKIGKKIYATGNGRCNLTNLFLDSSCYHTQEKQSSCGETVFLRSKLCFPYKLRIVFLVKADAACAEIRE